MVDVLDAANFLAGGMYDAGQSTAWSEGDFNFDDMLDVLDTADFLSAGLFDAGFYIGTAAASTPADADASATSTTESAIDLAFAAFAVAHEDTAARKKKVFATFR